MRISAPRSQFPIALIQLTDGCPRRLEFPPIVDNLVRDGEPFFTTRLGGEDTLRILRGFVIAVHQPLHLGVFVAVDDEDPVNELPERRTRQQRYDDELVRAAGSVRLSPGLEANAGMQDCLEFAPRVIVRKYERAHCGPVEVARRFDHMVAETRPDLIERRLTGRNDLAGDDIGVDNGDAEIGEHAGDRGFPAGNATGQPDAERGVWTRDAHLSESVVDQ